MKRESWTVPQNGPNSLVWHWAACLRNITRLMQAGGIIIQITLKLLSTHTRKHWSQRPSQPSSDLVQLQVQSYDVEKRPFCRVHSQNSIIFIPRKHKKSLRGLNSSSSEPWHRHEVDLTRLFLNLVSSGWGWISQQMMLPVCRGSYFHHVQVVSCECLRGTLTRSPMYKYIRLANPGKRKCFELRPIRFNPINAL